MLNLTLMSIIFWNFEIARNLSVLILHFGFLIYAVLELTRIIDQTGKFKPYRA